MKTHVLSLASLALATSCLVSGAAPGAEHVAERDVERDAERGPERDPERGGPSVMLEASRFRRIRGQVRYQGRDFAELALKAGMYKKSRGYFPSAERGAVSVAGATWHGSSGIGLAAYHPHMKLYSIFYVQERAVPGHHVDIVYANKNYIFFAYGHHHTLKNIRPSLEVYSAKHQCFARIDSVSTKGGRFGHYASKLIAPGKVLPAMGWDDRAYAAKERIPPRRSWPDKVELRGGVFKISYNTSWGIDEFVTQIQFTESDLDSELGRIASAKAEQGGGGK